MLPAEIGTARLRLRRWELTLAPSLKEALDESVDHLHGWIPRTVSESGPVPQLEARLRGYAVAFDDNREWLYAIVRAADAVLLGGIGFHPRVAAMRVAADAADRVEIGYWLRRTAVGRGYATEAAEALLALSVTLPGHGHVELRCDPRNQASVAVAQRLGFRHVGVAPRSTPEALVPELMIWERRP